MVYILSFFLCKSTLWIYRRLRDNPNVEGIGVCMRTCYEMHKNWSAVGKECEGYPLGSSLHIWWGKVQIPFMKMDRKYMGKKMEIVNQTHQLALILYASTVTNLHNPHPTIPFSIWKISGSSFLDKYKSRPIMTLGTSRKFKFETSSRVSFTAYCWAKTSFFKMCKDQIVDQGVRDKKSGVGCVGWGSNELVRGEQYHLSAHFPYFFPLFFGSYLWCLVSLTFCESPSIN